MIFSVNADCLIYQFIKRIYIENGGNMFGIFKKRPVDDEKVKNFVKWFVENNEAIIDSLNNDAMEFLNAVEYQLSLVYRDGFHGNIEFQYGYNDITGKYELYLFHLNNKFLKEATAKIKEELESQIGEKWTVFVEK